MYKKCELFKKWISVLGWPRNIYFRQNAFYHLYRLHKSKSIVPQCQYIFQVAKIAIITIKINITPSTFQVLSLSIMLNEWSNELFNTQINYQNRIKTTENAIFHLNLSLYGKMLHKTERNYNFFYFRATLSSVTKTLWNVSKANFFLLWIQLFDITALIYLISTWLRLNVCILWLFTWSYVFMWFPLKLKMFAIHVIQNRPLFTKH